MKQQRRDFLKKTAAGAGVLALTGVTSCTDPSAAKADPFSDLSSMVGDIKPITKQERQQRIEKARALMTENGLDAVYVEAGSSLFYFTGIRWGNSERMMAAVIPRKGEIVYVCPAFEEDRLRELITIGSEVRVWEEHESPYQVVAGIFTDKGIKTGRIGMEERVRFFLFDGIRKAASQLTYVSADPVTAGCRIFKSPNEIALMQKANDITIEAYRNTFSLLKEGMTQGEVRAICSQAHDALGAPGGAGVQFGIYTALPHGSIEPQRLKEGDVVLIDGGCGVDGYRSDITRCIVYGKPTQRQTDVWEVEREAQMIAFDAAKLGVPCEDVDKAARDFLTSKGFGPGYKYLLHRTGHGIGLDGHEWVNFVKGNKMPLQVGMCFSDEPMIAIKGEFGIRLEDCLYMTENGPKFFTQPSTAIDKPFG
jgi:Xaa-Pro dipeptidase